MPAPGHHVSLNKLRAFEAVARLRSFTAAAEELAISQPAVTVQVRDLERHFGVPLVDRARRRRVELTGDGELLYGYARRILAIAAEAEQAMAGSRQLNAGRLRLVVTSTAASFVLPPVLGTFKARYPAVYVELLVLNARQALSHLVGLHADLGIMPGAVGDSRLVTVPFFEDRLVLAVSPGHPFARRRAVDVRALATERLIMREKGSGTRELIERELKRAGVTPKVTMELASPEVMLHAIAADHGVALLSAAMVRREVEARRIVALDVRGVRLRRTFRFVFHRERADQATIRQFLETGQRAVPKGAP